ncbi:CaiB/BaiF CoA transferase family protein [Natrinema halophilum]|uniref:CaiB/BaiF CoA transferase family protein n=1 Tax=Natrinema halophilum TaxID=1699371 RepID=UPI001F1BC862|nr:CaiB/BaiF CoA-transferase family protein [Natrinema halophilum]UHQ96128.1 CoA transferase [Natrinema halophilum]
MDLSSITVLDLSQLLPGPYGTQLLAEMGADVIKIEQPDGGDYSRYTEPTMDSGQGAVFTAVNRGKESVTLDLKCDEGREAFYRLAAEADVVFEQFRPGVVDRLGVGYEDVSEYNSEIVYCSLSGYGQTGPYRKRVGHDLNYAGFAGLIDMTRADEDERPRLPGYPIGDMAGGTFAALSIVGALLSRELGSTGGNYIDISMTDAVLSFSQAVGVLAMTGQNPRPGKTHLTGKYPCYDVYETADGRYLTLAALEPKFWATLCDELDKPHLLEKHQSGDEAVRTAVRDELAETFRTKDLAAWEDQLGDVDVMIGRVNTPQEALEDPHLRERDVIKTGGDGPQRIGFPASVQQGLDGGKGPVPDLGEHTDSVFRRFGFDDEEIASLRDAGVVGESAD